MSTKKTILFRFLWEYLYLFLVGLFSRIGSILKMDCWQDLEFKRWKLFFKRKLLPCKASAVNNVYFVCKSNFRLTKRQKLWSLRLGNSRDENH